MLEMIVSIAIFDMAMGMVVTTLRTAQDHAELVQARMSLQESAREGINRMTTEIRQASISPLRTAVTNGGNTLTVQIPQNVDNAGGILWSNPITYGVGGTGNQLVRQDTVTRQTTVLANDVQTVNFTDNATPTTRTIGFIVTAQRMMVNGQALSMALAQQMNVNGIVLSVTSQGDAALRNPP